MKSTNTSLASLVLTLIMLLLVSLSLFWFLYRGWGPLTEQAQQADLRATRIAALEGELRQNSEALLTAQSTRDTLQLDLNEAIQAHQIAEAETIAEQLEKEIFATRVATLTAQLAQAQQTLDMRPSAPLVTIVQPTEGGTLPLNQEISVIAVASDASGLASLSVMRNGEWVTQTLAGELIYTLRLNWLPPEPAEYTVVITAVNTANVTSQPVQVSFQVADLSRLQGADE